MVETNNPSLYANFILKYFTVQKRNRSRRLRGTDRLKGEEWREEKRMENPKDMKMNFVDRILPSVFSN